MRWLTGERRQKAQSVKEQYLRTGCNFTSRWQFKSIAIRRNEAKWHFYELWNFVAHRLRWLWRNCLRYVAIKAQRRNGQAVALCGFGCQYDTERFLRLQDTEPAKLKFAFKSKEDGGLGYKEAIEYMNEYCGTNVIIPKVWWLWTTQPK